MTDSNPILIDPVVNEFGILYLAEPAMYCVVGYPIVSKMETLPFSGGSQLGTSVGSVGSQKGAMFHMYWSAGGFYGTEDSNLYEFPYISNAEKQFDYNRGLFSGLLRSPFVNARDQYNRAVYVEHSSPQAFNILSIVREIQVSDA